MAKKLELIREEKLYRLLPGRTKASPLEASGVAVVDDTTAVVIFDSLNFIAKVDLSLGPRDTDRFYPAPGLGEGYEDIALDREAGHVFCIIETLEDLDGEFRGFLMEFDANLDLLGHSRLAPTFESENRGFEGLAYGRHMGKEILFGLCEGNLGGDAERGGGLIHAFTREGGGGWTWLCEILLPKSAEFEDYASIAYCDGRLAVVSQASARLWVAEVDREAHKLIPGTEAVYRFPKKSYGNVEGIAWLSEDTLVAVSDRKKSDQPERCAKKDQSIHVFRIPGN